MPFCTYEDLRAEIPGGYLHNSHRVKRRPNPTQREKVRFGRSDGRRGDADKGIRRLGLSRWDVS